MLLRVTKLKLSIEVSKVTTKHFSVNSQIAHTVHHKVLSSSWVLGRFEQSVQNRTQLEWSCLHKTISDVQKRSTMNYWFMILVQCYFSIIVQLVEPLFLIP